MRGGALTFPPCPTCPSSAPAATYCHRIRRRAGAWTDRTSASRWTCLGRGQVRWRRYGAVMGSGAAALSDVRHTEPEALGNLAAVLQLCAAGKLRCSEKTRRPSAATIRTVAEALVAGDFYPDEPIASFAWPLLLQAGGLARLEGPRLTLTPKGRKALGQPGHEVIRGLWERWPRHAPIDEFSRVEQIKGQKSAAALSAAGPRRQAVAAALALCPLGEWIGVDDLFAAMRRAEPEPDRRAVGARAVEALPRRPGVRQPRLRRVPRLADPRGPLHPGRAVRVRRHPRPARRRLRVSGPCPRRLPADVGRRLDRRAEPLRRAARGAAHPARRLRRRADPPPTRRPHPPARTAILQVLANHDIVATADLAPADRLVLDTFATRTSDRVWTISTASLLAAVDAGRAPGELGAFLDERAVHAVPATVHTAARRRRDPRRADPRPRDPPRPRMRRSERRHAARPGPLAARAVHPAR